jgi:hypothetical protein
LPLVLAFGLVLVFGGCMNLLLASTGRESYPVVALSPEAGVERYTGNLRFDPALERRLPELEAMRARALDRAQRATGITTGAPERYVVRVRDFASPVVGATSQPVRSAGGDVLLVSVSSRELQRGSMDVEAALTHEITHGLMRERLGARYRSLPGWVREGLAVWAAGQLPERAGYAWSAAWQEGLDLGALLEEQPMLPSLGDAYLEDALLFQGLAEEQGADAVRAFIRALEREPPEVALVRVSGLAWLELEELRARAGRRLGRSLFPPGSVHALAGLVP